MLKLDWGDAQAWMSVAVKLYSSKSAKSTARIARNRVVPDRYPRENALNVAYVCAGYAFELVFKVLVKLSGNNPKGKHQPSKAYKDIAPKYRSEVEKIVLEHGWPDISSFLKFLDEHLCDPDRKYWGRPLSGGPAQATFHTGGIKGMDELSRLHEKFSNFVLDAINTDQNVEELWAVSNRVPNQL